MDIEEAIQKKKELEPEIAEIIYKTVKDFKAESGLWATSVNVDLKYIDVSHCGNHEKKIILHGVEVSIVVELP